MAKHFIWAPTSPDTEHPVDNRGSFIFLASVYKTQLRALIYPFLTNFTAKLIELLNIQHVMAL